MLQELVHFLFFLRGEKKSRTQKFTVSKASSRLGLKSQRENFKALSIH